MIAEQEETTEDQDSAEQTAFERLSESARKGIEQLVVGLLKEDRAARRAEVRRAWQQRAFKAGIQHLWYDTTSWSYLLPQAAGEELPQFMDVYNIYTPHWRSFVSILSQNPPGVNFVPDDLQAGRDVTAASYAEKMRNRVDRLVHMKDAQMEAADLFCTDGRTIARTHIDKSGKLRVRMYGVLESKVPVYVRNMPKWSYCILSTEEDIWELKDEFPDFADEIEPGDDASAESNYERYARLMILGSKRGYDAGDALKNLATRHEAWVRPWRYKKLADEKETGMEASVREEVSEAFPDGFRATLVSGKCVDCVEETLESALRVEWPAPGQGQIRPSMLHDLVPIQEAFNDILNMIREFGEYAIPARWVTDALDGEAIAEQVSAPGITHQLTVPPGASIEDLVFIEPTPSLPAETIANVDRLLSLAQFTTGDLPSLYGDGTPDQETASGQKMLSDQAKGQLSPAWAGIQWLFAGVYEIAVRLAAQMNPKEIAVEGSSGNEKFDPRTILEGEWGCYPDTDSSFPESTADKRASLQLVLNEVGPLRPDLVTNNLRLIKQYSGLADLEIPEAEAEDRQIDEFEQLLSEKPVPDEQTGQPTSSVPIRRYDDDAAHLKECKSWLNGKRGTQELRRGNFDGFANVELHAALHEQRIQQNAQANAPKPEPPKVSLTAAITDPNAISQLLGETGVQSSPDDIAASTLPEDQNQAADTQMKAAKAQHNAVLAAKEAVAPVKSPNALPSTPKEQ